MKLATTMSSVLAGALLFGSAFVSADRTPPAPPAPPAAPAPGPGIPAPKPPKPPKAPKAGGGSGITIQINGLDQLVDEQIKNALDMIAKNPQVPQAVRDKVTKKLEKVRQKLHDKLGKGSIDPDEIGELGDEIGREMDEFGKEMEEWGEQFGKQMEQEMEKKFGNFNIQVGPGHDDDDDDDDADADDDDDDAAGADLDDAIKDMGSLDLKPAQRDQIKKLRADSESKVAAAKRELSRAEDSLHKQLGNPATSDADIARSIDAITQQEAAIRKARILAWVNARRVLDDAQRTKVERAAKGKIK
jgi:Spy/CpxP family protein refolding chaperone